MVNPYRERHPVWKRRHRLMNPHPVVMQKYTLSNVTPSSVTIPFTSGAYSASLYNGLIYGVCTNFLQSTGYPNTLPNIVLPVNRAYQTALSKQDPQKVGAGENLGELGETLRMLRHPLQSLHEWFKLLLHVSVKKRRHNRFLTSAQALSDTWLEYRYGIMPVVYTIVDVMALVEKMVWDGFLVTKGSHEPIVTTEVTSIDIPIGDFAVAIRRTRVRTSQATVIITGAPDYKTSVWDQTGLRASNLPFIAVELTRLSFVLEWFVGVSSWMRTIIPYANRYIHSVQLCTKTSCVDTYEDTGTLCFYQGSQIRYVGGGKVTTTLEQLNRELNPQIELRLEMGSGISNCLRLLDSLSLALGPSMALVGKMLKFVRTK
jgi:hypothetical protein